MNNSLFSHCNLKFLIIFLSIINIRATQHYSTTTTTLLQDGSHNYHCADDYGGH